MMEREAEAAAVRSIVDIAEAKNLDLGGTAALWGTNGYHGVRGLPTPAGCTVDRSPRQRCLRRLSRPGAGALGRRRCGARRGAIRPRGAGLDPRAQQRRAHFLTIP